MYNSLIKLIKMRLANTKQSLSKFDYAQTLPENPQHDDVYLVAFPKSGITWLSFLMANVHLKASGLNAKATFFNADSFIPDIHVARNIKSAILPFPGFRVIKSHSEYNPFYNKLFYIVRDPRDVMVSYYHFLTNDLRCFNGSISDMVKSNELGIQAWCRHIEGWCTSVGAAQMINYIRYEDLKADARKVLERMYTVMGFQIPDDILDTAVENSSFSAMRKDEDYYSAGNVMIPSDIRFTRKGESGGYKAELMDSDIKYINSTAKKWLSLFKYVDT